MELILNELSICQPFSDINAARKGMQELLETCKVAIQNGASNSLRTQEDLKHQALAKDYLVIQWLNDSDVDKETQRYFKTLVTKSPYIDQEMENKLFERVLQTDFWYKDERALGLGIAYLMDTLSISFNSHEDWNNPIITVKISSIDEEGNITNEEVEIKHAVLTEHVIYHKTWFLLLKKDNVKSGKDLWEHRQEMFPSLVFCDRVEAQLSQYEDASPAFKQIKKKLFILENYFSKWSLGNFNYEEIPSKTTPESPATLKTYKEEHFFLCPDGKKELFSWHLRTTPGAGRIFFYPDEVTRKGIIGHIGGKLPTVKDPK